MENTLELQKKIEEVERKISIRTFEFTDDIEEYYFFLRDAITRELHAMTKPGYNFGCKEMTLDRFENIIQNNELLYSMFDLIIKREMTYTEKAKMEAGL